MVDEPTWIVLIRDVSHAVRIDGESTVVASLVLDADTGLVRGTSVDRTGAGACAQAMRIALTQPAGGLPPKRPTRVLCGVGHREPVAAQLAVVLGDGPLPETTEVVSDEAEDIFDSFVGHMAGLTTGQHGPADLDRTGVQRLTVAIAAVLAHDRQPDDSGSTTGTCTLSAGEQGTYALRPPH